MYAGLCYMLLVSVCVDGCRMCVVSWLVCVWCVWHSVIACWRVWGVVCAHIVGCVCVLMVCPGLGVCWLFTDGAGLVWLWVDCVGVAVCTCVPPLVYDVCVVG